MISVLVMGFAPDFFPTFDISILPSDRERQYPHRAEEPGTTAKSVTD
jgi:hypothetical protein